ncbi:GntR family transcriptional regulator [Paenibacillus antri]|uniref:GntR family transcriptional regulator n=2 Tax=Paenibacillus antri TaxID=2582848 RepID=A0A5R9GJX0_9BACL|nr:GntR family transcriptional regulator [Paenibacillus antri]
MGKRGAARPSLEKKAYQDIRARIISAEFLPGMLLSENELADTLGMSRTPIRAAISLLETEGFLESVRGRGVFVKEISFREFREMFEVLVSMQLFALDVAAARGHAFDLPALREQLERQAFAAESGDYEAYYDSSLRFVGTMVASCGNESMRNILETIKGKYMFKMLSFRKMNARSLPKPTHARSAHARIYDALERGDPAGAREAVLALNAFVYDQFSVFDI